MRKRLLGTAILLTAMLSSCAETFVDIEPSSIIEPGSSSLYLGVDTLSLGIGETYTLNAFADGDIESVRWVNSNESVLSLSGSAFSATLIGLKQGTAYVSAIAESLIATCTVTIGGSSQADIVVDSITLSDTAKTLNVGGSFDLGAHVSATGGSPNVTFLTSNPEVASVSKQSNSLARIVALAAGTSTISVKAGSKTATCLITVEDLDEEFYVRLSHSSLSLTVGATETLVADYAPSEASLLWQSSDPSVCAVTDGRVIAKASGTANVSATIAYNGETKSAVCAVVVSEQGSSSDYEQKIASWSKPGHLYLHYLRTSDSNYDQWALWIWQNYPHDYEGALFGANPLYRETMVGVTPETYGQMTNADCGGTDSSKYIDEYGVVIDVDLTNESLLCGKSRTLAPLVSDWSDISRNALGFLIVNQAKMDGSDNWESDGNSETYIKRLGRLMPEGKDSYLHVYCVEGNVANYQTSSGKQEFVNPTISDTTGAYRSKSDITNLKADAFSSGVSTSSSFLEDRPGTGYQIFVPSFADSDGDGFGDIKGITNKLDYLSDLGIDVLWLTPIQESNSYHGYDVTDYYKIDQKFGTLQDYQELIYKAHQRGMKVLMDMVINHTSKSNVLFRKSQRAEVEEMNGKTINYRDMYLWKYAGDKILEWNGVEGKYDASNPATFLTKSVEESDDWYKDGSSNYYYYGKFGSGMAELNYACQATRDYMTDMCKYWLSFGLDGFRLDAIKHIFLLGELTPGNGADPLAPYKSDYLTYDVSYRTYYDNEKMKYITAQNDYSYDRDLNVIFWKQFAGTIKAAYPNCFLVGENFDGWNQRIAPFYEAIDSQFDFSTYYHLHESTESGIVAMGGDIKTTLEYNKAYREKHINGAFTSNHDVARFINHSASTVLSEHHAEVNASNAATAIKRARWAGAITMLTPGVSWIYYGDELGMSGNLNDKVPDSSGAIYDDHGNNVDRWYRQPMRWGKIQGQGQVVKYTFGGIEILWDDYNRTLPSVPEQQADNNSLYNLFKALCHVKGDARYPTYGYIVNQWAENSNQNVLCLQISDGLRTVNAFINATDSNQNISALNQGTFIGGSYGASSSVIPANGFSVVAK